MCSLPGVPQAVPHESDEVRQLLPVTSEDEQRCRWRGPRGVACGGYLALAPVLVGAALVGSWAVGSLGPEGPRPPVLRAHSGAVLQIEEKDEYGNYAAYGAYSMEDVDGGWCGNSPMLNDFSSKRGMETAGWWFNWTDDFTFKPLMYKDFVPPYSYWGFEMRGSGAISLRVKGEGVLSLDFGNLLGTPGSQVSVYLNLQRESTAGPSVLSKTVDIAFHDADALTIVQEHTGIIVLNRISFRCTVTTTTLPISTFLPQAEESPIWLAEQRWKQEHARLQKAALLATKKQQEHYAAVKLEKAQKLIMEKDQQQEQDLERQTEQAEERSRLKAEQDQEENDRLVKALMAVLSSEGKNVDMYQNSLGTESTGEGAGEAAAQAALKRAEAEEKLASELRVAAQNDLVGKEEDLAEAERLEKAAQAERAQSEMELQKVETLADQQKNVRLNESWAEELAKNAEQQAKQTAEELRAAELAEDEQARESAQAAKEMKEALQHQTAKSREEVAKEQEKVEMQLELQKEKERERERMKAEAKHQALQHSASQFLSTSKAPVTRKPAALGDSLYCYALMLPFGYEPGLLAAQFQKKVGIYECDEYSVFTNSTVLLDTGKPAPVEVELLDFSLAVPYGGKWHTALNTGVFNKIWTKVHDMKIYLKHDWVVKADPDTVWFPGRLAEVLRRGLPEGLLAAAPGPGERRPQPPRRLQSPQSESCRFCKTPGHQTETCDAHVWWLQDTKGLTCEQALQIVGREDVDCGCKCTRLEACDLSADPDWSEDGHYIRGKLVAAQAPVYINNCRFGLHGPIEVLSSGAVTAYVEGLPKCEFLLPQPWGEDKYLDRCMLALGVTRVNVFGMLSEIACGEEPAPCGGADVAFHPFKKFEEYFACWAFAHSFGHGPASVKHHGPELSRDQDGFI